MKKHLYPVFIGFLFLSACSGDVATSSEELPTDDRPNIILVIADDLGKQAVGAYNQAISTTPNLDKWAREGWLFHNFYVTNPVCSPSRASLLTGRPTKQTGITRVLKPTAAGQDPELADSLRTIADHLQEAGYQTSLIGKWHLGYRLENHPLERGFDHFSGFVSGHIDYLSHVDSEGKFGLERNRTPWEPAGNPHLTELLTDEALDVIANTPQVQPYFMVLSYANPHTPYLINGDQPVFPGQADRSRNTPERYQAMVNLLDQQLGRIQDALQDSGDNTLVIFLSDNGQPITNQLENEEKKSSGKGTLFEGGINVPAIVYWPSRLQPGQIHSLYAGTDILPTVLQAAGVNNIPVAKAYGMSVLDSLSKQGHQQLSVSHSGVKMIRSGDWKAIFVPDNSRKIAQRHLVGHETKVSTGVALGHYSLLFNLVQDPQEVQNLAAEHEALVDSLWLQYQNSK